MANPITVPGITLHNDFIAEVALEKLYSVRFKLKPLHWQEYTALVPLKWKTVKFNSSNASKVPDNQGGVYTFIVIPRVARHPKCAYVVYIGETLEFRQRYRNYLSDQIDPKARPLIKVMLALWSGYLWYCYAPISQPTLINAVQNNLIKAFDPVINRMFPKEVQATVTGASL